MTKQKASTDQLITEIVKGIEQVKGENISILDLREIENPVYAYFIVCEGTSNTQGKSRAGSGQKAGSKAIQDKPGHVEGEANAEWILLDYVNVVVHIFQKQIREFYDIESLWGDAKTTIIETAH